MACRTFSGTEIAKALGEWNFERVGQTGSHLKLRYIDPNTGEKRTVVVPLHDELDTGTLKGIAEQPVRTTSRSSSTRWKRWSK
jgi:predicted RNA binding protein YcfA (HicA-like mRNA interferase family)